MSAPEAIPHTPEFRRRRVQNWVFLGAMYGFFYMSRYNLASVAQGIGDVFGWSNAQYGTVLQYALLTYGLSVFLNGPIADRIGGKRALLIGAAGGAIFNFLFGLVYLFVLSPAVVEKGVVKTPASFGYGMTSGTVLTTCTMLWAANHYFQSYGALSIVKVNAAWFAVRERGSFAGIFGIMIQAGRLAAFALSPAILAALPWQYCFWIPAAVLCLMFVLVRLFVEDSPARAGLGEFDTGDESPEEAAQPVTFGFVLRKIFTSRNAWIVALSSMCIGFVRNGIDHWWSKYMTTVFELDPKHAKEFLPYFAVSGFTFIAAVVGGLVAGVVSDRVFGARRAPVIFFAFLGQAACLGLLHEYNRSAWAGAGLLFAIAFFIQAAHSMVGGAASMDFGGRKAVATAAGFFDGAQYLAGGLLNGYLGPLLDRYKTADHHEYTIWPLVPLPFALLGAVLMATLWNARPGRGGHGGHGAAGQPGDARRHGRH